MKVPSKEQILEKARIDINKWSMVSFRKDEVLINILDKLADDLLNRFLKDTLEMVGSIEFTTMRKQKRR